MIYLPEEIQLKILHYYHDIDVSRKKKYFETVHHELLHGWWMNKDKTNIYTVYIPEPIDIRYHSKEEIYKALDGYYKHKHYLYYPYPTPNPHALPDEVKYEFVERIPRLVSLNNNM